MWKRKKKRCESIKGDEELCLRVSILVFLIILSQTLRVCFNPFNFYFSWKCAIEVK